MPDEITNTDDIIDVRDVIDRIDWLKNEIEGAYDTDQGDADTFPPIVEWMEQADCPVADAVAELGTLKALLTECAEAGGGDHMHEGQWYPVTLVRDSYFETYAQDLAEETFPYPSGSREAQVLDQWPYRCIDWEKAARELRMDYTSVEFDGVTYWTR